MDSEPERGGKCRWQRFPIFANFVWWTKRQSAEEDVRRNGWLTRKWTWDPEEIGCKQLVRKEKGNHARNIVILTARVAANTTRLKKSTLKRSKSVAVAQGVEIVTVVRGPPMNEGEEIWYRLVELVVLQERRRVLRSQAAEQAWTAVFWSHGTVRLFLTAWAYNLTERIPFVVYFNRRWWELVSWAIWSIKTAPSRCMWCRCCVRQL